MYYLIKTQINTEFFFRIKEYIDKTLEQYFGFIEHICCLLFTHPNRRLDI